MINSATALLLVVAAVTGFSAPAAHPATPAGSAAATAAGGAVADVVIRAISVIDVRQGLVLPDRDIVVRGTHIASVAPAGAPLPPAKTVIEGRGKYAWPGLIDPQVRLADFTRASVASLLTEGITAVRDLGTEAARIAEWRRALAFGQLYAPRIARTCSEPLTAAEPGCRGVAPPGAPALTALMRARATAGPGLHDVLERLVRDDGMSSHLALRAATLDAAQLLALPDLGELVAGSGADIVVTTADPLADIRHARAIDAVIFRGEALTRAHLNLMRHRPQP